MNKRFVAVSTVTGSRTHGCFSNPRCDLNVAVAASVTYNFMVRLRCVYLSALN